MYVKQEFVEGREYRGFPTLELISPLKNQQ
jgi:hypothetical protein